MKDNMTLIPGQIWKNGRSSIRIDGVLGNKFKYSFRGFTTQYGWEERFEKIPKYELQRHLENRGFTLDESSQVKTILSRYEV